MPDRPLVSIVTPTLDRAGLLRHTIESVKRQSYPHIEHIIVDGGSTDGTLEMLESYEGSYPMRWVSERDDGMYQAINKGLRSARGDILAYLNSDDLYFPWTVETVVQAFGRHRDADFVFGDAIAVDDVSGRQTIAFSPPFDLDFIRRSGFLTQPTVFWRRAAFESLGGFDESLRYVADCDFWMRAGAQHRFHKVNEFLAVERDHDATLRESVGAKVWPELEGVRSRYVTLDGKRHQQRTRRHAVRKRLWSRLMRATLLLQACTPSVIRRGPFARLVASGSVSRIGLAVSLIPGLSRARPIDVAGPSRRWLEPPPGR